MQSRMKQDTFARFKQVQSRMERDTFVRVCIKYHISLALSKRCERAS